MPPPSKKYPSARGGGGQALPAFIDPGLQEVADSLSSSDESTKDLFPPLPDDIHPAPITDRERRLVAIDRELQAKRRAGPFWTGTAADWAEIVAQREGKFNPFEDAPTYGRKRTKKQFQLPDLKKVRYCYPEFLPKELRDVVRAPDKDSTSAAQSRNRKSTKTSTLDALGEERQSQQQQNDYENDNLSDADDELNNNTGGNDDDDQASKDGEDGDAEGNGELGDEVPDETDEEDDNDYNAEKYFNDGEEDFDEGAGEEYGGDEGY